MATMPSLSERRARFWTTCAAIVFSHQLRWFFQSCSPYIAQLFLLGGRVYFCRENAWIFNIFNSEILSCKISQPRDIMTWSDIFSVQYKLMIVASTASHRFILIQIQKHILKCLFSSWKWAFAFTGDLDIMSVVCKTSRIGFQVNLEWSLRHFQTCFSDSLNCFSWKCARDT